MNLRVRATMSMIGALLLLPVLGGTAQATSAGDVVEAGPTTVYLVPGKLLEVPVNAWHLRYRSTSATGEPDVVSGTLLVPKTSYPLGRRPIAGYAVGTH